MLCLITLAKAGGVVAILEIIPGEENIELTFSEYQLLTDELRNKARASLPAEFTVLTRDNILSLMPPEEEEAECLSEGCAVDIGRAIGAEYITQGYIRNFQGKLTLTVELYESMSGNMLGSFVTVQENATGLLSEISKNTPELFEKVPRAKKVESGELRVESDANLAAKEQVLNNNSPLSTLNSQLTKKSNTSLIVAISLDVLGAAMLGYGIYQHAQKEKHYDDYKKSFDAKLPEAERAAVDKKYDDAESARKSRDVGFIIGSVLLASGITVHILF